MDLNALYQDGEGKEITGYYRDVPFHGVITLVRSTLGTGLNVYVDLKEPIRLFGGDMRDSLIVTDRDFKQDGGLATNLHVYF